MWNEVCKQLLDINNILICGVSSNNQGYDLNETDFIKYAPLTSVDVERGSSTFSD